MIPPRLLPIEWTLGNYKSRLQPDSDGELSQTLTFVKNGAIISLSVTFISMVLASLADQIIPVPTAPTDLVPEVWASLANQIHGTDVQTDGQRDR